MKNRDEVLGNTLKPAAHVHKICFALQFSDWCKPLRIGKREVKVSPSTDFKESGTESEENESVNLQLVFEIDISALHYIRAAGKCHQTTVAKRVAQSSPVHIVICFRR